jgi:hypothetical protein
MVTKIEEPKFDLHGRFQEEPQEHLSSHALLAG